LLSCLRAGDILLCLPGGLVCLRDPCEGQVPVGLGAQRAPFSSKIFYRLGSPRAAHASRASRHPVITPRSAASQRWTGWPRSASRLQLRRHR